MKGPARIRIATPEDGAGIVELERHFPSDRMSARSVRDLIRSKSARVLVAANPAIVGALVLLVRRKSSVARIYSIVIDAHARGQGLAQRLIERAEGAARDAGRDLMSLEVRADNAAARALYARAGYAETAALPRFYEDGADGVRLQKRLFSRTTQAPATISPGARRPLRKKPG